VLALCFVVPYLPRVPKEELVRTSLWALAFMGAAAGWGSELAQRCWPGERIGLSLRVAWGSSLFAFVGGTCAMVSGLSKAVILMWMVGGAALAVRACITGRDRMAAELYARFRATRLHLPLAGVVAFLAVVVLFRYLGGASDFSSNPYDDDVSYYPFAKQLLERGTLIDPFSFRRMSTLGGQALYHAALLIRVQPLHLNVFDRGMCFALAVGLLASHRVGDRKATLFARVVSVAFIVVLPNTGINSASYYSGLAFFIAFFQTLERLPEDAFLDPRSAVRRLVPLALTGAALCTLRQNYQAVVGIVLVSSYGLAALRVRRTALRSVLVEGVICLVLVGVFVAPWLVLSYRSNDTFLFPLMKGTFRAGVDVQSREMTLLRLLRFFADVWLQPDPIYTLPLFFLVGLFVRERSLRRPMAAQWIGGFVSLLALCAAFTLSVRRGQSRTLRVRFHDGLRAAHLADRGNARHGTLARKRVCACRPRRSARVRALRAAPSSGEPLPHQEDDRGAAPGYRRAAAPNRSRAGRASCRRGVSSCAGSGPCRRARAHHARRALSARLRAQRDLEPRHAGACEPGARDPELPGPGAGRSIPSRSGDPARCLRDAGSLRLPLSPRRLARSPL
jgi:hypothetical protein